MVLKQFIKRNIIIYFRDKISVFFSLLSTIIVLILMIAFLGDANVESTLMVFENDSAIAHEYASRLIAIWTISGIIVVNAVSISMSLIGNMVRDEESGRLVGFFVAPVNRAIFVAGYIISAIFVAFIMCLITFGISQIYLYLIGGEVVSLAIFIKTIVIILAIVFSSAAFLFLCATFIHSSSAYSGFSTVIGTLIGFFAAIYVPYGAMPSLIQKSIKFIPAFQGSSAIRELLTSKELDWFNAPAEIRKGYSEYMGMVVNIGNHTLTLVEKVIFMFAFGIMLALISSLLLMNKRKSER